MNFADLVKKYLSKTGAQPFNGCKFSGSTGVMAAALAADAAAFTLRYPDTGVELWALQWLHVHVTCLDAFTTPVTAGRRLHLVRSTDVDSAASGGAALDVVRNDSRYTSEVLPVGRISTTAALTTTGISFDTAAVARLALSQVGTSGADYDELWAFEDPLILIPGQTVALTAGALFDAVGTWQATVKGGGAELP
jgi:hypothetical protein